MAAQGRFDSFAQGHLNGGSRREAVTPGCVGEGRFIQEEQSLSPGSGAVASCPLTAR
jgi:hypothetical protein